jgi:L-aspartate oxidase
VIRDAAGLSALLDKIGELEARHGTAPALIAARLTAQAALERRESRGGHWRSDFPETSAVAARTFTTLAGPVADRVAAE